MKGFHPCCSNERKNIQFLDSSFESIEKRKRGQAGPGVSRSGQVSQDMRGGKSKNGQNVQGVFGLP
jgi:hypothetical protein